MSDLEAYRELAWLVLEIYLFMAVILIVGSIFAYIICGIFQ